MFHGERVQTHGGSSLTVSLCVCGCGCVCVFACACVFVSARVGPCALQYFSALGPVCHALGPARRSSRPWTLFTPLDALVADELNIRPPGDEVQPERARITHGVLQNHIRNPQYNAKDFFVTMQVRHPLLCRYVTRCYAGTSLVVMQVHHLGKKSFCRCCAPLSRNWPRNTSLSCSFLPLLGCCTPVVMQS